MPDAEYDYVVVGSGAGGGTVAARLAEAGRSVLVLESGGDPRELHGRNALHASDCLPDDYDVPAFHACSTENEAIAWDYFVRHYTDNDKQRLDMKCCVEGDRVKGVLYPRAGALGGCTGHNALIFVSPDNADWDAIARDTGDASWSADRMRKLLQTLEQCRHRPLLRWLGDYGWSRHGWDGWLRTEKALPLEALQDRRLLRVLKWAVFRAAIRTGGLAQAFTQFVKGHADPNDWGRVRRGAQGLFYTPLTTADHRRIGTRERLRDVERRGFPLAIELDAHATKIVFDGTRAVGVEYLKGARLYRAFKHPSGAAGEPKSVGARHDVILAAGAFNTPQLLMLSGIGPSKELAAREKIRPVKILEGVGANLQDRYEVGVGYEMSSDWLLLKGSTFSRKDPQYRTWAAGKGGVYASNGALLAVLRRSSRAQRVPDLLCFALLGTFSGYVPDYSRELIAERDRLTWAVLKGHTNNRAGCVRLRSDDPLDTPEVHFNYFEEGSPGWEEDLAAVVSGVKFVRAVMTPLLKRGVVQREVAPGVGAMSDEQLAAFVRANAWGHHASSTCAIGDPKDKGVIDSSFRVHGVSGLRVVDASVFPRIPGLFIVSAVYMIGEKAAQTILRERARQTRAAAAA